MRLLSERNFRNNLQAPELETDEADSAMNVRGRLGFLLKACLPFLLIFPGVQQALGAARCANVEPSATFSLDLALPAAQSPQLGSVRALIAKGDFKGAEKLLSSLPSSSGLWLWEGILRLRKQQTFASIRALEKAAAIQDSVTIEAMLAVDYLLLNQRILAKGALTRGLKLNGSDVRVLYLLGRLRFMVNDFSGAQKDLSSVLEVKPDDLLSLFYLGLSEWRLGHENEARGVLSKAVEVALCLHVAFPPIPETLAKLEIQMGDASAAVEHCSQALKMAVESNGGKGDKDHMAKALVVRGKAYAALHQTQSAQQDWQQAVSLNPQMPEAWYLLSRIYQKEGKNTLADEALNHFKEIQNEL